MKQDLDIPEDSIEYLQEEENWEWFIQEVELIDFSVLSRRVEGSSCIAVEVEDRNGLPSEETFSCGSTNCDKCIFNAYTLESWEAEDE